MSAASWDRSAPREGLPVLVLCQEVENQLVKGLGVLLQGHVAALVKDVELRVGDPFFGDVGVGHRQDRPLLAPDDERRHRDIAQVVQNGPEGAILHATQAMDLYNRMATGYRILVDDLGDNENQLPLLATAIHRALRYLSEILLTNYQIYVQYPAGLWSIIHALDALAEKFGIAGEAITDTTLHTPDSSSINRIYKQILLLSLACPYRLRQNEILYVYNALLGWVESSQLLHADASGAHGLFAVDLAADKPPVYRALRDGQQDGRQLRILDTTEMAQQMQLAAAQESSQTERSAGLGGSGTMQRLMLAWGVMPKRRFSRHREDCQVKLVAGLNAIHQMSAVPVPVEQNNNNISETIHSHQYLQDPTLEATTSISTDFSMVQSRRSEAAAGNG